MSHRNEPARERRRRALKQQMSLSSLPLDDNKRRHLTLENHFGWMVLQKCQVGDGNIPRYPQVVQYHEKPDLYGPDYQKVTHVLYLKGKEDSLGKSAQETQTSERNVAMAETVTVIDIPTKHRKVKEEKEKKEFVAKTDTPHKEEKHRKHERPRDDSPSTKRKLISEYFSRKRDRSTSVDRIFRPIESEEAYKLPENNPVVVENYTTDYVPPGNKKPKTERGRTAPKSWQLRAAAGAETHSDEYVIPRIGEGGEYDEHMEQELKMKEVSEVYYSSRHERTDGEVLWDSPTKTNQYLYISKERASRTLRDRSRTNK